MADSSGSVPPTSAPLPAVLADYEHVWNDEHQMFHYVHRALRPAVNVVAGTVHQPAGSQAADGSQPDNNLLADEDRHVNTEQRGPSLAGQRGDIQHKIEMPDKRSKKRQHSQSSGSSHFDSPMSENDTGPVQQIPKPRKMRAAKNPTLSLYKAKVEEAAARVSGSTADLGDTTLLKIKKMLDRADQHGANESEARIALRRADELMRRLNITRSDVLAHSAEGQKDFAGHSIVTIRRTDDNKELPVRLNYWVWSLCHAIGLFFAVKSYTTKVWMKDQKKTAFVRITFYGFAENTVTAAHAFQMVYNLISHWALEYRGIPSRNSYSLGVCQALKDLAESEKKKEEIAAKQAEEMDHAHRVQQDEANRQAELYRLKTPHIDSYTSDNDEDNNAFNPGGSDGDGGDSAGLDLDEGYNPSAVSVNGRHDIACDFGGGQSDEDDDRYDDDSADNDSDDDGGDTEEQVARTFLSVLLSPEPERASELSQDRSTSGLPAEHTIEASSTASNSKHLTDETASVEAEPRWDSHTALITYRHQAEETADRYLKQTGRKLRSGRKSTAKKFDQVAYKCGEEDAKKIDIRRKAIAD